MNLSIVGFLLLFVSYMGYGMEQKNCIGETIDEKLACVSGLRYEEDLQSEKPEGYRLFLLYFRQPTDHNNPTGETFEQKVILLHKSFESPMVLQTNGYMIVGVGLSAVADYFKTNQMQVEHRYFRTSTPASGDLSKLTIWQSAADFHRITVAMKQIYSGRWLNTGASKGGLASVFHRRFFPNDVDGTLALVAPISYSTNDERYITFLDNVGGSQYQTCRKNLIQFQKMVLTNKEAIAQTLKGNYSRLGSPMIALEHAVIELPFIFWQHNDPDSESTGCGSIPGADANLQDIINFLNIANGPEESYSDPAIEQIETYYIQAAFQLGAPAGRTDILRDQLSYIETFKVQNYTPPGTTFVFDEQAMPDIQDWVKQHSEKIMYIYGQFDPWTAGSFIPGSKNRDNHYFTVSKGNHYSTVELLKPKAKKQAWAKLGEWLQQPAKQPESLASTGKHSKPSLEELEYSVFRRRGKIPK